MPHLPPSVERTEASDAPAVPNPTWDAAIADRLLTPVWVFDIDRSRVVAANGAAVKLWRAKDLDELRARDLGADMSTSVRDRLRQYQSDFVRDDSRISELWTLYPKDGPTTLRVLFSGHRLADGRMAMLCEALSEMHDTPERLRSSEALLHIPVMITLYDRAGVALYRNPAARGSAAPGHETLTGRFADPADHATLMRRLAREGEAKVVARVETAAGLRWHEITVRDCRDAVDGRPARLVSEIDVTASRIAEDQIRFLAHHDLLTGLPNRTLLQMEVERRLEAAAVAGERVALLFIDLDRFKTINDSLGHGHGDQLLIEVRGD